MQPGISSVNVRRPNTTGLLAVLLVFTAVVARTLTMPELAPFLGRYLRLEAFFLVLFVAFTFLPRISWLLYIYLALQCALIIAIQAVYPQFDFAAALFVMLSFQVPFFFGGRMRWGWIAALVVITAGSLMYFLGPRDGLALALTDMAAEIVIPAFMTASAEMEAARLRSQALLNELSEAHRQLEQHAGQVEELATIQERDRVARVLHDSVSQLIFSISLTARSAEELIKKSPARLPDEIARLQAATAEALLQLRSFVSQLKTPPA